VQHDTHRMGYAASATSKEFILKECSHHLEVGHLVTLEDGVLDKRFKMLLSTRLIDQREVNADRSECAFSLLINPVIIPGLRTDLVDRPVVLVVLPPQNLNPVHEDELPREQASHIDVLEGLGQILGQTRLVPEDLGVDDLLNQDSGDTKHSPASMN